MFNSLKEYSLKLLIVFSIICGNPGISQESSGPRAMPGPQLIVLGNVQDAGSPQAGCKKDCCIGLFENPDPSRKVVALGVTDSWNEKTFLFEATPDMPAQMKVLQEFASFDAESIPSEIFLSHAHIGHYTGLMYLGKEAMNTDSARVNAMPRMKSFLESNGPWSQLVSNGNIFIDEMDSDSSVRYDKIEVVPIEVPHRDEFSETAGFIIHGPNKSVLFIPDIDKWEKWEDDIKEVVKELDLIFIDGTFYDGEEINNRDISEIPHPFVIESMELFEDLDPMDKAKINFIHFNHTNPLLNPDSEQSKTVLLNGFNIARYGDVFNL